MRALVNPGVDPARVPAPDGSARAFHRALPGYAPTPLRPLPGLAAQLGLREVAVKDESDRLGLPAFKILGASWAVERALRERPGVHTLVAATAGNHGRAVARVARERGLRALIYVPARASEARRAAIAAEGAEVRPVAGAYEETVAAAAAAAAAPGRLEVADVGTAGPAAWVIDGYATLFAEIAEQADADVVVVPAGVGSLAAAAARFAARAGARVLAVEPVTAACLTASLAAGAPRAVPTPGTAMAGLDCAEVSPAAWPSLHAGIHGTVTVADAEAHAAMRELAAAGLRIGDSGAAPVAALRALCVDERCARLRAAVGLRSGSRVVCVGTEGATDPESYRRAVGRSPRA